MNDVVQAEQQTNGIAKIPLAASVLALVGLCDSIYLTVHHYSQVPVPCSVTGGCESVLTSSYAEIAGIPLALFGAIGYFSAFSLAILAAYGNRLTWKLFGLQTIFMAGFSVWLIWVQAFRIGAFCQFCLLSAATSITLFLIAVISRFWRS